MNEDPKQQDDDEDESPELSADPEEALRLENELTRLRLQAEYGAQFGGDLSGMPPEVEQKFLENIMRMEAAMSQSTGVTVSSIIGNPELKPAADLGPDELESTWADLNCMLESKNIRISFSDKTPVAERYRFTMEEVMPLPFFEGMPEEAVFHIPYEEFYPDHKAIMERLAVVLLEAVFRHRIAVSHDTEAGNEEEEPYADHAGDRERNQDFSGEDDYDVNEPPGEYGDLPDGPPNFHGLTSGLILADGRQVSDETLDDLTDDFHAQFARIEGFRFNIGEISHTGLPKMPEQDEPAVGDPPVPTPPRMGHVEGMLAYDVVHHDGERQTIQGPYKLYMQAEGGWWQVFYFVLPGWVW